MADSGASDFLNEKSSVFKVGANIKSASSTDHYFDQGLAGQFFGNSHRMRPIPAIFKIIMAGATFKPREHFCVRMSLHFDGINSENLFFLLHFFCKIAIVGEENEAFTGEVESSYGIDPLVQFAEVICDRRSALWICQHGDDIFRFIKSEVDRLPFVMEEFTIELDGVFFPFGFITELGDFAVDGDYTFHNEFFGFASRSDADLR